MYSDSLCSSGTPFNTPKMRLVRHKTKDYLVGGCGDLDKILFLMCMVGEYGIEDLWKLHLTDNWPPTILKDAEDTSLLIVTRDGKMCLLNYQLVTCEVNEEVYTIGSGSHYARAAMALGKTPAEAIEFTATMDDLTGLPVRTLRFPARGKK